MASTIGSLSTSTSTSIRGYGGLASGLDRDELINGMTIGTTTKINKQEQKKQQIEWMQEAVRTISDKMISFHGKYTETFTSPTNMFSDMLWGRNKITTLGKNASKVSVTGSASSADAVTIMGVRQKAENAKWTSTGTVSDGKLQTDEIKFDNRNVADFEGTTLTFRYGGDKDATNYSITLKATEENDLKSAENVKDAINAILEKETTSDGKKLSTLLVAGLDSDGKITFRQNNNNGNNLKLTGGTALEKLGFDKNTEIPSGKDKEPVSAQRELSATNHNEDFAAYIGGKSLTFSYNGTSKSVNILGTDEIYNKAYEAEYKAAYQAVMDDKADGSAYKKAYNEGYAAVLEQYKNEGMSEDEAKEKAAAKADEFAKERQKEAAIIAGTLAAKGAADSDPDKNTKMLNAIAASLQDQLQSAFGKDRIKVESDGKKLTFTTTIPGEGEDKSSVLTLTGGHEALMGEKGLGLRVGESTRLNLDAKIAQSGIDFGNGSSTGSFKINGTTITIDEKTTLKSLMEDINKNTNVKISYQEAADKFTLTSKDNGASGSITFDFKDENGNIDPAKKALAEKLFGIDFNTYTVKISDEDVKVSKISDTEYEGADGTIYTKDYVDGKDIIKYKDDKGKDKVIEGTITEKTDYTVQGKDAIVSVRYAGSDDIVDIRRDSNTFTIDGLTIGVKETFGNYNHNNKLIVDESEAVEINASVDVDKLVDTIKSFVEGYNEIVDMVNTELTTKHEKDYTPLSSEQKSELSDDEISKWEAKAKSGLLYGDSDLRSLSMDLRTVATSYVWELQKVGINVSSSYSDNGKLSVDESKLRSALETDPENVKKLFTSEAGVGADGKPIYNGVATNLKSVMDKYVKTMGAMETKGVLIRKAGSKSAAMSMTDNTYYNQLQQIEKLITQLNDRLKTERDRYVKQFTSLETLIANMNSQSSYLSSMSGY